MLQSITMRRISILSLVLLLLAGCSGQVLRPSPLCVMSFNIRNSSSWNNDGENDWTHRRQAVADMIRRERPDAIGMQEVLPDQLAYLDSAFGNGYARIGVGRDDGKAEGENMCIYYRKDRLLLMEKATYWLSATPETPSHGWDAACRRTVTLGHFKDTQTGREFYYLNTHLDHIGPVARRNSVLMLCDLAEGIGAPVIIGGDMNSDLTDSIFLPLADHGLLPARDMAGQTDTSVSYNAFGKGHPSQIDHFFVRMVSVRKFQTLNGDYGVPYISDHYPVRIDVFLNAESTSNQKQSQSKQ